MGWVAAVAGTALGCYMVSLKVASERASLEQVENRIVLAQRDIRVLQTEIGTRGRLEQLESWNVKVLALSAPQAHQFLEGEFQLATLAAPKKTVDPAAPVVLASAPAPGSAGDENQPTVRPEQGTTARDLMQVASYTRTIPESDQKAVDKPKAVPAKPVKVATKPATSPAKLEPAKAAPTTAPKARPVKAAATDPKAKPAKAAATDPKARPKTPPATTSKPKDAKARQ
ncbi:hypothetical protein [Sphingomonas sp. LHG3406-1]|uniref:hypothetical protein n=1 Tax=Sphingomonas sp. LHG3406-1 TaxID=2804617 RepID=UPI002636CBAC|nr:hypothetical protein [Sphingomonas sp. LHG3406-1]